MTDFVFRIIFLLLILSPPLFAGPVSELKKDETLVFFNTSAWFDEASNQWHIPVHGWVFEPEDSKVRKSLIESTFKTTYSLNVIADTSDNFDQRINLLLADNERNKTIVIRFADRTYALPDSAANGHFSKVLKVNADIVKAASTNNQLTYQAVLAENDSRVFSGKVNLIPTKGISIISDIDDTIKISYVTNRKQLLNHTFYLDFKAVPGMAPYYLDHIVNGNALHFVSSSPWQLYPKLDQFITKSGFPPADYHLKSFRFKDSSLMNLFTSSLETKPPQIIEIIKRYPERKFILVGDSGEHDPEIYAEIHKMFPDQVIQILIRNVSGERINNDRFKKLLAHLKPELWQLFTNIEELLHIK